MEYWEIDSNTVAVKFFGEIGGWRINADDFVTTLNALERKYANIVLKVHSNGGSVLDGNVIFNAINQSKANIIYEIVGMSASMSSTLQMGAKRVRICENGLVMIHRPTAGIGGNADDLFSMGKLLKGIEKTFLKLYASKTGRKESDLAKYFDGVDHWFTAEEALAAGVVDEIIPAQITETTSKPDSPDQVTELFMNIAASLGDSKPPTQQLSTNTTIMKELIIAFFGLSAVNKDSSDTAVLEALKAHYALKDGEIARLNAKVTALSAGQIETLITASETALGKPFEAEQKANLKQIGEESLSALKMALAFLKPAPAAAPAAEGTSATTAAPAAAAPAAVNLIDTAKKPGTVDPARASWTWAEWCDKDEAGLKALSKEAQGEIYKRSYGVEMPS